MNRLQKKLEKIGRDPKITAKAVGLRYVSDSARVIHVSKPERAGAIMMLMARL
jgi:hypothetical protein